MLKLVDISWKYFPDGQVQGLSGLEFKFEDDGKDFERSVNDNVLKRAEPATKDLVDACEVLLNDIKETLEKKNLQNEWVDFLLAKNYGFFTSEDIANENCIEETSMLFTMISHISHEMQNEKTEFLKRPPMFAFKGKPKYFTGNFQFYENFNIVLVECSPSPVKNLFALAEMTKNVFSCVQCVCNSKEEVEEFYKNYVEKNILQCDMNRVCIIIKNIYKAKEIIDTSCKLKLRSQISFEAF